MSLASRILKTRDIETTLCINGTGDNLLKGPLGYDFALVAFLSVLCKEKLLDTMKVDDYNSFIAGNEVKALITDKENDNIRCVMVQLGNGTCIRGCELTDADFRKDRTVLTVGCVKGGKNYNFVLDRHFDLQAAVHECLLRLWETVYNLNRKDPDFWDKLLELHWQYNPGEEKPQTKQPQQPAQPQRPQQPSGASTDIQSDDTTGYLNLGKGIFVSHPDLLYQTLSKLKADQGANVVIDKWAELIAIATRRAIGACVSAAGGTTNTETSDRKLLSLLGHKAEAIDALFGKVAKDGSDKDDKKDANSKDDTDTEEFKFTPYRRCLGFASAPKMEEGELIEIDIVREALFIAKSIVLDEDSSKLKMRRFARVWDVLQTVIDEASATGRNDVGNIYLHYKLGKINAFRLEFSYDGADYELMFGVDENK